MTKNCILTLNGGSSSIKMGVHTVDALPIRLLSGVLEARSATEFLTNWRDASGKWVSRDSLVSADFVSAVPLFLAEIEPRLGGNRLVAIGHRVVFGGTRYRDPVRISSEVIEELKSLLSFDRNHLPAEIALIEASRKQYPNIPQVAVFDTAFHRSLPEIHRLLPLPRKYEAKGLMRYGFHGLSYTFLMEELHRVAGSVEASQRIVLAHLGSGASLAAVRGNACVDTTMSLTPTSGIVMGTRTGDLDPSVILYLMRNERMSAEEVDELVNQRSGLLGISETSGDMRNLLSLSASDSRAAQAVEIFCVGVKKAIGAFAATLGGIDTLVFSGGIGENSAAIRAGICTGLNFLGIHIDSEKNKANSPILSTEGSSVTVRMIRTDEEQVIARAVAQTMKEKTPNE